MHQMGPTFVGALALLLVFLLCERLVFDVDYLHHRLRSLIWSACSIAVVVGVFALWDRALAPLLSLRIAIVLTSAVALVATGAHIPLVTLILQLSFAYALGSLFADSIPKLWWALPFIFVVGALDAWAILSENGLAWYVINDPDSFLFRAGLVPTPAPGFTYGISEIFFGISDFVFLSTLVGVTIRREQFQWTSLLLWSGSFAVCLFVAWETSRVTPALPFLAFAFLISHGRACYADFRPKSTGASS